MIETAHPERRMVLKQPKKCRWKRVLKITATVLVLHSVLSLAITKLVYDAIFTRYDHEEAVPQMYAELAQTAEPVSFPSGENMLSGRFFDSSGDSLVVIVQGINSYMEAHYPLIQQMVQQDHRDVFIFDMTGSCNSQGDSAGGFPQAVYDLEAALDYIDTAYDYENIFLFGHSRGAYAACCILSRRNDIDGVVAVNGPDSAMEAVVGTAAAKVGWIAYGNYPYLWLYQTILFGAEDVGMSALESISGSDVPVLIIQAEQDETIPPDTISIYSHREEIPNAEFVLLPGGHTSVLYDASEAAANPELMTAIDNFLDTIP